VYERSGLWFSLSGSVQVRTNFVVITGYKGRNTSPLLSRTISTRRRRVSRDFMEARRCRGWAQKMAVGGLGADTEGAVARSTKSGGSCKAELARCSGQAVDENDHGQDAKLCSSCPAHSGACRQIFCTPSRFPAAVSQFVATRASAGSVRVQGPTSLCTTQLSPFVTPSLGMTWTTSRNASEPNARQAGQLR